MKQMIKTATENKTPQEWKNWLVEFGKNPYDLTKEENLALRDTITNCNKAYNRVTEEFFYNTLKPLVSGLKFQISQTYKVVVDESELATTIYREFWDEGTFSRLMCYKGDCSIFSWISIGAAQVVYDDLEKLGVIKKNKALTTKNTSLRLKSISDKDELNAVIDLVNIKPLHDMLYEVYVNRKSDKVVMNTFKLTEVDYKKTLKLAENTLKDQLIATKFIIWHRPASKKSGKSTSVNLVSIALGDVSGYLDTTTSEDALTVAENKFSDKGIFDEIQDVLQLKYPNKSPEQMWSDFVKDEALKCGMTDNMLDVWIARYLMQESPDSIAVRLGMRRSNVDNLYSRANKALEEHISNWWKKNS